MIEDGSTDSERQPIFVLGIQRSGTTLAANLLAGHPQIAGVSAERHRGIHESVFFSHFARFFGDWVQKENREQAKLAFAQSDYAVIAGLGVDDVAKLDDKTCGSFFAAFMDKVALDQTCSAWVEKSPHHTVLGQQIADQIPSAAFVLVFRDTYSLALSRIYAYGRQAPNRFARFKDVIRAAVSNGYHQKHMRAFQANTSKTFCVAFDDLVTDPKAALSPCLAGLGLKPLLSAETKFAKNSSFTGKKPTLSLIERGAISAVSGVLKLVPLRVMNLVYQAKNAKRDLEFPHWVWPEGYSFEQTGLLHKEGAST